MIDWFRSWHGAPSNRKWRTIAKRANVPTSLVVALAWDLLDRASQATDRGSFAGFDAESFADFMDCEAEDVTRILEAMAEKDFVVGDRLSGWERRQVKREDEGAAERQREKRTREKAERDAAAKEAIGQGDLLEVTQCHDPSRNVTTEQSRVDEIREDTSTTLNAGVHALDDLEAKLRDAADLGSSPNPSLCDLSPICGLIDAGYGLDDDILPVLRAKRSSRVRSWGYFVEAIREAKARRNATASAPIPIFDRLPNSQRGPPQRRDPVLAALEIVTEKYR